MPLDTASRRALQGADYMDLTTKGRKSGRPRTVELSFVLHGEEVLCLAGSGGKADWYQNLLCNPNVSIRVGRIRLKGKAGSESGDAKKAVAKILNKILSGILLISALG
ncbi:MAG: nitroreductase family deazaflavin-dependent oxidoreductase [Candidatus Binatia bacterium]